jgi:DNA helicase-2/ATP-dependent DNA helicase PcrA
LHSVASRREKDQEDQEKGKEPVLYLMTMHSSKGLQFDGVWLLGLNEGGLPLDNQDLEEERRIFYVGITRAISNLYISYVKNSDTRPSRFLDPILKQAVEAPTAA